MSDEMKLSLAREIYGTKHASRASFSPTLWAGVERAWEWIVDAYATRIKRHPSFQNLTEAGDAYVRGIAERAASDFFTHAKAHNPNDTTVFVVSNPQEPPMKQDHGCRGCNDPAYLHTPGCIAKTTPPWTDEQREAARGIWMAHATGTLTFNAVLEAISHVAPLFVEQRAVPMAERALHTAHEFTPHGINLSATCGTQGQIDTIPWSDILRHAPKRAVPSIEACVEAFESLCYDHESKRDRRAGVESVRALCIGEQGDGASVPGDSGLKSGHNMERGSGCPASDDHADRETSTPHAPKEQAPSTICGVAPWPSAEDVGWSFVSKAIEDMFAPAIRTRDERIAELQDEVASLGIMKAHAEEDRDIAQATIATLTKERDEARQNLTLHTINGQDIDSYINANSIAEVRTGIVGNIHGAVGRMGELIDAMREDRKRLTADRDAALARVAELEQEEHHHGVRLKCALDRVDELEKRGAVDVEACAREINQATHDDVQDVLPEHERGELGWYYGWRNVEKILRKHARPAKRSVTGQELERLVHEWLDREPSIQDRLQAALASVGIEVKP